MRVGLSLSPAVPLLLALCATAAYGGSPRPAVPPAGGAYPRQAPFVTRPFRPFIGSRWIGDAIAYGPHRDGQYPGGPAPTPEQLRQDLRLMSPHWNLLRTYGSVGWPETLLSIIRKERIPMRVVLGVWIEPEALRDSAGRVLEDLPRGRATNRAEIEAAVCLAATYPEIVAALCVANETQVSWSAHRVPLELLVGHVREARARTKAPVTSADDIDLWNEPTGHALAEELDFVATHIHPLWRGQQLEGAVDYTRKAWAELCAAYPGRTVVIGETGWPTAKLTTGEQGKLMKGSVGEAQQAAFCGAFAAWAERERVVTFFFEAFDENWKGGPDPDDAEKHWGFFRADRTPKPAVPAADR